MNYTFLKIFIKQNFFLVGLVIWLIWLKAKLFDLQLMVFGSWPVFWFVKVQKKVTLKYLDIKVCIDVLVYIEHMYMYMHIKSHCKVIYMCLILVHIILITSERFKW